MASLSGNHPNTVSTILAIHRAMYFMWMKFSGQLKGLNLRTFFFHVFSIEIPGIWKFIVLHFSMYAKWFRLTVACFSINQKSVWINEKFIKWCLVAINNFGGRILKWNENKDTMFHSDFMAYILISILIFWVHLDQLEQINNEEKKRTYFQGTWTTPTNVCIYKFKL